MQLVAPNNSAIHTTNYIGKKKTTCNHFIGVYSPAIYSHIQPVVHTYILPYTKSIFVCNPMYVFSEFQVTCTILGLESNDMN